MAKHFNGGFFADRRRYINKKHLRTTTLDYKDKISKDVTRQTRTRELRALKGTTTGSIKIIFMTTE